MLKLISLMILLSSCANTKHVTTPALHPTAGVLDLGRSAYLKGCVDGSNASKENKKSTFEICKSLAKTYEHELKEILNSDIKKK